MVVFCCLDANKNVVQLCGRWLWCARHRTLSELMIAGWSRLLSSASRRCGATATTRVQRLTIEN